MGYEDREYMQNDRGGDNSSIMPGYPTCRYLIYATVILFLAQVFITRPVNIEDVKAFEDTLQTGELSREETDDLVMDFEARLQLVSIPQKWLELDTAKVAAGQVWRLLTSAFLHDRFTPWHIIINLALLYWFGRRLEDKYGSREFLFFYLAAAIFASGVYIALQLLLGERIPAIGASGAVMAVICVYAILHPYEEFNLFFFIPIQMRFLLLLYVAYDLHPILLKLAGTPIYTGTAHAAHLGGLLFGFLYWKSNWRLSSLLGFFGSSPTRRNTKSQFANPGPTTKKAKKRPSRPQVDERLVATVDSILQKISEQGEASLTEREREILNAASKQYRDRQD